MQCDVKFSESCVGAGYAAMDIAPEIRQPGPRHPQANPLSHDGHRSRILSSGIPARQGQTLISKW
jgi:hypothetical protein